MTIIKRLLFHQRDRSDKRNITLRQLDQSWRLGHKDEVFLFGRVARADRAAEDVTQSGASPSRLWLGDVPAAGQPRPALQGKLAQETYVRMIIPVRTSENE